MAKLKLAGKRKKADAPAASALRAIPCLIIVIGGLVLLGTLFFYSLSSSTK